MREIFVRKGRSRSVRLAVAVLITRARRSCDVDPGTIGLFKEWRRSEVAELFVVV